MPRRRNEQAADDPEPRALLLKDLEREITVSGMVRTLGNLGLHTADLSLLSSGKIRQTIAAWRDGERLPPAEIAEHIDDARYTALVLLDGHDDLAPSRLAGWMRSRSLGLDAERPLAALAEGRFQEVLDAGQREIGS
jgi:hypothetical protein